MFSLKKKKAKVQNILVQNKGFMWPEVYKFNQKINEINSLFQYSLLAIDLR